MAYRWKWNCFHCSLIIIKSVSILIANGQSTVKESENVCLSIEELLNDLQYKVLEEIGSLKNEINFANDRVEGLTKIVNASREEISKMKENTSKIIENAVSHLSHEINRSRKTLLSNATELFRPNGSNPVDCSCLQSEQLDRKMQAFDSILQKQKKLLEGIYWNIVWPRDCSDLRKNGFDSSGIYEVTIPGHPIVNVSCDMDSNGTGWLVFQRRMDGSEDFYRGWNDYANGFGNKSGEFWLGNDLLHLLTSNRKYKLRIDLEDWDGNKRYAEYGTFSIGSAADKYRLNVTDCSANAGDSFTHPHNGMQFSTWDSDNDRHYINCAENSHGAWWYGPCYRSNLNGPYLRGDQSSTSSVGVNWRSFRGDYYSLKFTQMKITPADIHK